MGAVERCVGGICWPSAAPAAGSPGGRTEAPWGGPPWRGEAGAAEATGLGKTTFNKRRGVTGLFFATARSEKYQNRDILKNISQASLKTFLSPMFSFGKTGSKARATAQPNLQFLSVSLRCDIIHKCATSEPPGWMNWRTSASWRVASCCFVHRQLLERVGKREITGFPELF